MQSNDVFIIIIIIKFYQKAPSQRGFQGGSESPLIPLSFGENLVLNRNGGFDLPVFLTQILSRDPKSHVIS